MQGWGDRCRETDLIFVITFFQLVDACLQAACNVFKFHSCQVEALSRGRMRVSAGGGVVTAVVGVLLG